MSVIRRIKELAKNSPHFGTAYNQLRRWKADYLRKKVIRSQKKRLQGKYHFEDRSRGCNKLCIVLAGYKEYLWLTVFGRLKRFAPEDIDVCILSSGKYSQELSRICAENRWSYLSTQENQVCAIQNIAIYKFPNAEYIYKLDEDIFITENYFENMMRAYDHAREGVFEPGVIAPLIPINGYGYVRILRKLNLMDEYERRFGKAKYSMGKECQLESSLEAARFFWGGGVAVLFHPLMK